MSTRNLGYNNISVVCCGRTHTKVVPKPLTSATQVVTTSQTPQRLIMPATHLPQLQPNLTNLPPGTVLTPAHGSGNMGYTVLPAPYVTQVRTSAMVPNAIGMLRDDGFLYANPGSELAF